MSTEASRAWWKKHEREFFKIVGALRQPSNGTRQADGLGIDPVPVLDLPMFLEHKASHTIAGLAASLPKAVTQLDVCPPDRLPVIALTLSTGRGKKARRFLLVEIPADSNLETDPPAPDNKGTTDGLHEGKGRKRNRVAGVRGRPAQSSLEETALPPPSTDWYHPPLRITPENAG